VKNMAGLAERGGRPEDDEFDGQPGRPGRSYQGSGAAESGFLDVALVAADMDDYLGRR
jgi:hypothetical protein